MRKFCKRFCHLWWAPWQETKRCLVCGAFDNLTVGENSITASPAGVGDLIRWSGTKAAVSLGDLGMSVSTGRPSVYVNNATRDLATTGDVVGAAGVQLLSSTAVTPYGTITDALAAAGSGDIVQVGPGTYAESVTVPAGVTLRGSGPEKTSLTGAIATGTRVLLGNASAVESLSITLPTDATYAVYGPSGGTDYAGCTNIRLRGAGANGVGIRCRAGNMFLQNCWLFDGACATVFDCHAGTMTAVTTYIFTGTPSVGWKVGTGARLIAETMGIEPGTNTVDAISVGAGTLEAGRAILLSCTNALSLTANGHSVSVGSFEFVASVNDILVDAGVSTGTLQLLGGELSKERVSAPGAYWTSASIVALFSNVQTGEEGTYSWGKLRVGCPERPQRCAFGAGATTTRGMKVLTTDSTASGASDGGNFLDKTAEASGAGTFTFQGNAVNHTILIGSTLQDGAGLIKWYSHKYTITTASSTNGVYVVEIWNGVAWVSVQMLINAENSTYRYANNPFIRANVIEYIDVRLNSATTWASKTINGTAAYWMRVRISTQPTTLPVFDHWRNIFSHSNTTSYGLYVVHGLSRWKETVFSGGNVYGEIGNTVDVGIAVGSGGSPTGWTQQLKNSNLNTADDGLSYQFTLPRGVCTACPITFRVYYSLSAVGQPTVAFTCLPIQVAGVLVADPAGGVTPVARTVANTETLTAKAGQTSGSVALPTGYYGTVNKLYAYEFGPFNIDGYYEGDLVAFWFDLVSKGTPDPTDVNVWAIEVVGTKFVLGEPLFV